MAWWIRLQSRPWRGLPDFASKCSAPDTVGNSIRRPSWLETQDLCHLRLNRHRHKRQLVLELSLMNTNDSFMPLYCFCFHWSSVRINDPISSTRIIDCSCPVISSYFSLVWNLLQSCLQDSRQAVWTARFLEPENFQSIQRDALLASWAILAAQLQRERDVFDIFMDYGWLWYVPMFCQKDFSIDIIPLRGSICFKVCYKLVHIARSIEMSSVSAKPPLQRSWP